MTHSAAKIDIHSILAALSAGGFGRGPLEEMPRHNDLAIRPCHSKVLAAESLINSHI